METKITVSATTTTRLTDAVRHDVKGGNKWCDAGEAVRDEFGTIEKAEAARDTLLAAIYAGMPKDQADAARAKVPRKNGEEWVKASEGQRAAWLAQKDAKKDAIATAHTFLNRVLHKYAFPKVKGEGEGGEGEGGEGEGETSTSAADTRTKLLKAASAILSKMQNDEAPAYRIADAVKACNALIAALAPANDMDKANNAQAGSGQRRTK